MESLYFHLNVTQDVGHGMTIIFICCVLIVISVLLDLNTGVKAARKNKEKIRSHMLRRTVTKILDYLRVLLFGVMIDVLGLAFPWYSIPYCAVVVTLGVVLIEAKSVLENYQKMRSAASALPDMISDIIECASEEKAEKIIKLIKADEYGRKEHPRTTK
jgi:signal transduction histidine kinase